MGCHLISLSSDAQARVRERFRFRAVRRTYGEVDACGPDGPTLCEARIDCQIGFAPRTGEECLRCPRLLSWTAGPTEREVTLRCAWLHTDPVADRMTGGPSLVGIEPSHSCAEADRVAASEGVHRLLVISGRQLVGIVCRHDLACAPGAPVATAMQRDVWIIDAGATLGEAVAAMRELDVGCLPVARQERLVGIITRGDLLRSGVPKELFS